jgi:hypothetical protein
MITNIVDVNRERECYLTDGVHAYFLPKGWADHFSDGVECGLKCIDEDGNPDPEIYCYAPTHVYLNSPIDTMFVSVAMLERMIEITPEEAQRIHPKLFEHLTEINENS